MLAPRRLRVFECRERAQALERKRFWVQMRQAADFHSGPAYQAG